MALSSSVRLRNPLGLLVLTHPSLLGPEEISDGFYANNDKTLSFINISIFSTIPYDQFRGLEKWKHGKMSMASISYMAYAHEKNPITSSGGVTKNKL